MSLQPKGGKGGRRKGNTVWEGRLSEGNGVSEKIMTRYLYPVEKTVSLEIYPWKLFLLG